MIDEFTMLETTLDELDGGSLYSVQIESIDRNKDLAVSTVKTVLTQNQSKFSRVDKFNFRLLCYYLQLHSEPNLLILSKLFVLEEAKSTFLCAPCVKC